MGGEYHHLPLRAKTSSSSEEIIYDRNFLRQQVRINDMHFGFMSGRSTEDTIFIVRQLQEQFYAVNKTLYTAFVVLGKAFDRAPRRAIRWALRKLDR